MGNAKQLYWTLSEKFPDVVARFDRQLRYVYINHQIESRTGIPAQEYIGKTNEELGMREDLLNLWNHELEQVFESGKERIFEFKYPSRNGVFHFETRLFPEFAPDGSVDTILCISRDNTEHIRADEALLELEEKYRNLVENSLEGIGIAQGNRVVFANRALLDIFGYDSLEEFIKIPLLEHVAPECRSMIRERMDKREQGGFLPPFYEYKIIRKDGAIRDLEITSSEITLNNEKYVQSTFRDITERKQAEEALRESELRFHSIIEQSPDGIVVADEQGNIVEWNRAQEQMTGLGRVEVQGHPVWDVLFRTVSTEQKPLHPHEQLKATTQEFLGMGYASWLNQLRETEIQRPDGTCRNVQAIMSQIRTKKGYMSVGITRDITERKRAEEALRESEAKYRSLFENSVMGISQALPDGHLVDVNAAYAHMYGYANPEQMLTEVTQIGQQLYANPEERREVLRILNEKGVMEPREITVIRRDGSQFYVLVSAREIRDAQGNLLCYQAEHVDITERKKVEEALRESETRYRIVADNTYDWEFWTSPEGKFIYTSPSCKQISGYRAEEFAADPDLLARIIHPEDEESYARHLKELGQAKCPGEVEFRIIRPDGSVRWIEHVCQPVFDDDECFWGIRGSNRDITERKRAEETLWESEERFRFAMEATSDGIWDWDVRTDRTYYSPAYYKILGYEPGGFPLIAQEWRERIYPDDLENALKVNSDCIDNRTQSFEIEFRMRAKSGEWRWILSRGKAVIRGADGKALRMVGTHVDITERKRAEAERETLFGQVHAGRKQLQVLSHRLLEAQENERRSIARELHDEIGQTLTALKIDLQVAQRAVQGKADLANSISMVEQMLQQVRNISLNLHPSLLDDLGLAPALRWLLDRQGREAGIVINFDTKLMDIRFPADIEIACFRAAQEALTNILRHAQARQVHVKLRRYKGELQLVIRDDGVGFDVAAAQERAIHGESFGLLGLQERINLAGGHLEIRSAPGHGTMIRAHFPLAVPGKRFERRKETR